MTERPPPPPGFWHNCAEPCGVEGCVGCTPASREIAANVEMLLAPGGLDAFVCGVQVARREKPDA